MCGRFYTEIDREEMQRIVDAVNRSLAGRPELSTMRTGEVCPGDIAPVYVNGGAGAAVTLMRWGFPGYANPARPAAKPRPIINARCETIAEKPAFRRFLAQRCLIPATAYFEWAGDNMKKQKYAFWPKSGELFYMAAIFREAPDSTAPVFTILTRDAAPAVRAIHDRMPVILGREARRAWMRGEAALPEVFGAAEGDVAFRVA